MASLIVFCCLLGIFLIGFMLYQFYGCKNKKGDSDKVEGSETNRPMNDDEEKKTNGKNETELVKTEAGLLADGAATDRPSNDEERKDRLILPDIEQNIDEMDVTGPAQV